MISVFIVLANMVCIIISLFTLFVIIDLNRLYQLDQTIFFIVSTISLLIWNITHLLSNIITNSQESLARNLWMINMTAAFVLIQTSIFGFIGLRTKKTDIKFLIYNTYFIASLVVFVLNPTWIDTKYDSTEGWRTQVLRNDVWVLFSSIAFVIVVYEIIYPLAQSMNDTNSTSKRHIVKMIIAIIITLSSNMIFVLSFLKDLPIVFRYIIVNTGFAIFASTLWKHPFIGFYNPSFINGVIEATVDQNSNKFNKESSKTEQNKSIQPSIQILNEFKEIMHPIRLVILNTLMSNMNYKREDLRKMLKLNSGRFEFHLRVLKKFDFVRLRKEFINNSTTTLINIDPKGIQIYQRFCDVIQNFMIARIN